MRHNWTAAVPSTVRRRFVTVGAALVLAVSSALLVGVAPASAAPHTVSMTVTTPDGLPLDDAMISADRLNTVTGLWMHGPTEYFAGTTTPSIDLEPGTYRFFIAGEHPVTNRSVFGRYGPGDVWNAESATPVVVSGGPVTLGAITLNYQTLLYGGVVDDLGGFPQSVDVYFHRLNASGGIRESIPVEGGFLEVWLPVGTYKVEFRNITDSVGLPMFNQWHGSSVEAGATVVTLSHDMTEPGTDTVYLGYDFELARFPVPGILKAGAAPRIAGSAKVGTGLTATPGTWTVAPGAAYTTSIEWLRGSTVVARGASYRPTATDAGNPLRVRVTARSGTLSRTAVSSTTPVVKHRSTSRVRARASKNGTVKLTVTVAPVGRSVPNGKVQVRLGAKVLRTVAVKKRSTVVTLRKQKLGRKTYSLRYLGSTTIDPSTDTVSVKVQ